MLPAIILVTILTSIPGISFPGGKQDAHWFTNLAFAIPESCHSIFLQGSLVSLTQIPNEIPRDHYCLVEGAVLAVTRNSPMYPQQGRELSGRSKLSLKAENWPEGVPFDLSNVDPYSVLNLN